MRKKLKTTLFVLGGFVSKVNGQKSVSMSSLLPKLQTSVTRNSVLQDLSQLGLQRQIKANPKEDVLQGMVDSQLVLLKVRRLSKNGPVVGYSLVFQSTKETWLKKKEYLDKLVMELSKYYEQSPLNSAKVLPKYCEGKEALCFKDGIAKYQSSWYWNDAVRRVKSVDILVDNQYHSVIEITDNRFEVTAD